MKQSLFFLSLFIAAAVGVTFKNQAVLVPFAWAVLLLVDRRVFRIFLNWKFLLFLALMVIGMPLVCGEKDVRLWGVPYSREVFQMGVVMAQRGVILVLAIRMFTNRISLSQISASLQQTRLHHFSEVFALAMDSLPTIRTLATHTFQECRQAPEGKNMFSRMFGFFVKLLVAILLYADQVHAKETGEGR